MMHTPPQSRHKRAASPPLSLAGSSQFTTTPQSKLNVVARLALEGKARQGEDGATIRMYLKLSIPMESVSPGSTIPLFPEENLKLLSAQTHPLDIHSAPYSFSSSSFPLLNNAARALHLPALSQKSYLSVFGVPTPASSAVHSSRTSSSTTSPVAPNTPPLDEKYTGHIIVSGYNISYILPKEFPPRFNAGDSALRVSTFSATQMRRPSVSERSNMHFMAVIELWIPYVSRPPKAPFLIAIPVPRCLSNSIKLRIYPPTTTGTSSSMASLSSADEDPGAWELASEPHVTRTTSRSGSSADMADDESSDSSAYTDGSSGGILVQGTFPSTERLRVRWAQPTKNISSDDGRRRVGVKEATGEMTAVVLGKAQDPSSAREGILMRLEYKGTCKGIWFPGVATMLGMDIGLEVKGADVVWPPGEDTKWIVTGGTGYTGFDVALPSTVVSRQPSLEFPTGMPTSSMLYAPPTTTRQDPSSSTSSLLRAPLPNDHLPDYSFESSPTSLTPSVTLSSVSSLPLMSEGRSRASSDAVVSCRSPALPVTIHINMNDIIPPSKSVFTFSVTGIVLVLSRQRPRITNGHGSGSDSDTSPIVLPRFCVLAADLETVSTIIRNESEGSTVEVYYISGDLRDAQTRKTVLQRNTINRCGNDGARIALRPISRTAILQRGGEQVTDDLRLSPRHSPLNGNKAALSPLALAPIHGGLMRRKRDGPLMISFVDVIVTPLLLNGASYSDAHAVRVHIHAPSDSDTDWLEFGLAQVASLFPEEEGCQYQVEIVSVSIDGVPVRFDSSARRDEGLVVDLEPPYDEKTQDHWVTWVKVHGGDQGGLVTVDYVVSEIRNSKDRKRIAKRKTNFDILIPTFALPVGRLKVTVETFLEVVTLQSNFAHQQRSPEGYKLLHYSLDRFFIPTLSLAVDRYRSRFRTKWLSLGKLFLLFLWIFPVALVLILLINLGTELRHMRQSLDRFDVDYGKIPVPSVETIFITTTILPSPPSTATEADNVNIQTTTTSFTSSVSAASPDPTLSTSSLNVGDRSQPDTTTFTSIPTPSSLPRLSVDSLIPIPALPFDWSKFRIAFPPTARKTVDRMLGGLGIVWQIFRKAYHYPLDPP